jgi:hypothetical protein
MEKDPARLLEAELESLTSSYPGLRFRFCRVMGRRISHIAGDTSGPGFDELRLQVGKNFLLLVSGSWTGHEASLNKYALELGARLGDGNATGSGDSE